MHFSISSLILWLGLFIERVENETIGPIFAFFALLLSPSYLPRIAVHLVLIFLTGRIVAGKDYSTPLSIRRVRDWLRKDDFLEKAPYGWKGCRNSQKRESQNEKDEQGLPKGGKR